MADEVMTAVETIRKWFPGEDVRVNEASLFTTAVFTGVCATCSDYLPALAAWVRRGYGEVFVTVPVDTESDVSDWDAWPHVSDVGKADWRDRDRFTAAGAAKAEQGRHARAIEAMERRID